MARGSEGRGHDAFDVDSPGLQGSDHDDVFAEAPCEVGPTDLEIIDFMRDRLAEIDAFTIAALYLFGVTMGTSGELDRVTKRHAQERLARVFDHLAEVVRDAAVESRRLVLSRNRMS